MPFMSETSGCYGMPKNFISGCGSYGIGARAINSEELSLIYLYFAKNMWDGKLFLTCIGY